MPLVPKSRQLTHLHVIWIFMGLVWAYHMHWPKGFFSEGSNFENNFIFLFICLYFISWGERGSKYRNKWAVIGPPAKRLQRNAPNNVANILTQLNRFFMAEVRFRSNLNDIWYIESNLRAFLLLNLLNSLRKRDKMLDKPCILVAWIFYEHVATNHTSFGVSKLNRRLHRLVWVYTFQNITLMEITCRP